MPDKLDVSFTNEEVANQAMDNAAGLTMATISYMAANKLDISDYVASVGRQFAPGWAEMKGQAATEIARLAALNMVSVGGTLESLSGSNDQATAVITGWPSQESREFFGVATEDVDKIWNIFLPIANFLGFDFAWDRNGNDVSMTFSRA